MKDREKVKKLLARQLAKHYNPDDTIPFGPCACSGLEAVCVDCPLWWNMFLDYFDRERLEAMVDLFFLCQNRFTRSAAGETRGGRHDAR